MFVCSYGIDNLFWLWFFDHLNRDHVTVSTGFSQLRLNSLEKQKQIDNVECCSATTWNCYWHRSSVIRINFTSFSFFNLFLHSFFVAVSLCSILLFKIVCYNAMWEGMDVLPGALFYLLNRLGNLIIIQSYIR